MKYDKLSQKPLLSAEDGEEKDYGGVKYDNLEPITLTWSKVNVFAKQKSQGCSCFRRPKYESGSAKQILTEVSGIVRPGELLAIMGASGAGKTTLMNYLTGQGGKGLRASGEVRVNGRYLGRDIKYISAYVQQDDLFVPSITVKEHLWFQAQLRIEEHVPDSVRQKRVEDTLTELGMSSLANARIGKPGQNKALSGGERKRLSFASEVITNPALMFCDEPTSGLDSYMAQTVVETLRNMASRGRTILCTIHQPSSAVYALMDRVCFMAEGRVAYIGSTDNVLKFFDGVGYPCPTNHNPADFFIHTLAVIPGEENQCRNRVRHICDSYEQSNIYSETQEAIEYANRDKITPPSKNDKSRYKERQLEQSRDDEDDDEEEEQELNIKYRASWWKQFRLLLWRTWVNNSRNPAINRARFMQITVISLIVGLIYSGQQLDQKGVQNLDGALFLLEIQLTYGNTFMVVNSFPSEYPLFKREHLNGVYRVAPYYLSHVLAELPSFVTTPFIMSLITYFMIGFYLSASAFFMYVFSFTLMSFTTVAFGHFLSTSTVNVTLAVALAPVIINPMMFFGGYFLNTDTVPWYVKPIQWISWFGYTNEMLVVNQWRDVEAIACEYAQPIFDMVDGVKTIVDWDTSMCFTDGVAVIESFSFYASNITKDALCLVGLAAVFETLAYILLVWRSRQKQ